MHVLFVPSWYPANSADTLGCFFREQALALRGHGIQLGVITPALRSLSAGLSAWKGPYGIKEELDKGVPTLRLHGVRAFSWHHSLNIIWWERAGLQIFERYIARHGLPDVLHIHSMIYALAWAKAIHRQTGIPFIVTEHSSEFALGDVRRPLLDYLTEAVRPAAQLFGVSSQLCKRLSTSVPPPRGKAWEVMPNLVSSSFAPPPKSDTKTKRDRHFTFLNVAGLHRNKGQHHLLRAFALACTTGAHLRLRIVGDGPEALSLRNLSVELGVADKVTFLGGCTRECVALEMQRCDAFVLSSSYETFGVVVLEALMCGRPVLSTRCGGPEDIIRPGKDGLLVDRDSPQALAEGMCLLAEGISAFNGAEIQTSCDARYAQAAFVKRHADAYNSAATMKGST
jgi:glycosyltransferase involved in cell wall biosynthesis